MKGYSPGLWAKKVGVKVNVISNIHGPRARQNPSLNYILSVALATQKPVEYFLFGKEAGNFTEKNAVQINEPSQFYSDESLQPTPVESVRIPSAPDPQMGRRIQFWREDMGLSIVGLSKRTDLSVKRLQDIEDGHTPSVNEVVRIAEALRCTTDFILGCGSGTVSHPFRMKSRVNRLDMDENM